MIRLSLNTPEAPKQQAPVPFASALAAAVEAAGEQPVETSIAHLATKKQPKQAPMPMPSNGLLTRGARWLQQKGRSKKRMQMIETVSLGDKRFVALVKVDGREFLLGGAPSSVGMLADLGAHGLGDLLSLPLSTDANVVVPAASGPLAEKSAEPAQPRVPVATIIAPVEVAEAKVIEPVAFAFPEPSVRTAPTVPARIDVTVEADENESEWPVADELELAPTPVVKTAPLVVCEEPVKVTQVVTEVAPVPVVMKAAAPVEKLGPVAVPTLASIPALTAATSTAAPLNFTFQMWPAAPVSAPAPVATIAVPELAAAKMKTGIDLESCPELLGEPYLLALVEKTRGAAA